MDRYSFLVRLFHSPHLAAFHRRTPRLSTALRAVLHSARTSLRYGRYAVTRSPRCPTGVVDVCKQTSFFYSRESAVQHGVRVSSSARGGANGNAKGGNLRQEHHR